MEGILVQLFLDRVHPTIEARLEVFQARGQCPNGRSHFGFRRDPCHRVDVQALLPHFAGLKDRAWHLMSCRGEDVRIAVGEIVRDEVTQTLSPFGASCGSAVCENTIYAHNRHARRRRA